MNLTTCYSQTNMMTQLQVSVHDAKQVALHVVDWATLARNSSSFDQLTLIASAVKAAYVFIQDIHCFAHVTACCILAHNAVDCPMNGVEAPFAVVKIEKLLKDVVVAEFVARIDVIEVFRLLMDAVDDAFPVGGRGTIG